MAQAGFIFTANFIGFTGFIMLGGIAADRWGKKTVLTIAVVGMPIALLLFPMSPNFLVACFIVVFIGGFCGFIESIANALIADLNIENPGFYINFAQVFFGIGALVGPILAGIAVSAGVSWKSIYYILACLFLIIAVVFIINKLPPTPKLESISWVGLKNLITDKKFLLICLCMVLYTGAEVSGWGWMSTFLKQNLHFSMTKSSIAVGVFWFAIVVGRLICTPLTLKYSTRIITMVLAFISVLVTALSGIVRSEFAVWAVIIAMGLAYSSQWGLIVSYGNEHYKRYTGTVFALLVGSGGLGMAILPFLTGIIGQYVSIRSAMISLALPFLLIGLIFTAIDRIKAKKV